MFHLSDIHEIHARNRQAAEEAREDERAIELMKDDIEKSTSFPIHIQGVSYERARKVLPRVVENPRGCRFMIYVEDSLIKLKVTQEETEHPEKEEDLDLLRHLPRRSGIQEIRPVRLNILSDSGGGEPEFNCIVVSPADDTVPDLIDLRPGMIVRKKDEKMEDFVKRVLQHT